MTGPGDAADRLEDVLASLRDGDLAGAGRRLDGLVHAFRASGRREEEGQAARLSAAAHRLAGRLDLAASRVAVAVRLAEPGTEAAAAAHAEAGDLARARGDGRAAAAAYDRALQAAAASGMPAGMTTALLGKRAAASALAGDVAGAAQQLDRLATSLTPATVEEALGAFPADDLRESLAAVLDVLTGDEARQAAAADPVARAPFELVRAARLLVAGDVAGARSAAIAARRAALEAEDPTTYVGAALATAQLAEAVGDRAAAYESLAVGWATVAAWLGDAAAVDAFEPPMRAVAERWGGADFNRVRADYAARLRAEAEAGGAARDAAPRNRADRP